MPIYAADLALARTKLTHASGIKVAEVTYAVDYSSWVPITGPTLADDLQDSFADEWKGRLDSNVTIGPTLVLAGVGTDTPVAATSSIATVNGSLNISSPPPNNCAIVQKKTGFVGRANRGRFFLPWCMDESTLPESGRLDNTTRNQIETAGNSWLLRLGSDNTPLVIANRTYDAPWTDPDRNLVSIDMGNLVTTITVDAVLGSQRTRLR